MNMTETQDFFRALYNDDMIINRIYDLEEMSRLPDGIDIEKSFAILENAAGIRR